MKARNGLARNCLLSALLGTTALVSTGALAADMVTKAAPPPATDDGSPWWFQGTVEAGWRGFTNDPQSNGMKAVNNGKSLAGYYEYSDVAPGAFGNFDLSAGSKDGLYRIDAGGRNVGYDDQSYYFDWSKAGEHYFNFYWDQSPHVYSQSAMSPYFVRGNTVNLNPATAGIYVAGGGGATFPGNSAGFQYGQNATPFYLGIQRDTAAASYRWTPGDAWDFDAAYAYMTRTGNQVMGVYRGDVSNNQLVPKPVDDNTQNYDAKGQYVGTSFWGQRFVVQAGYEGSQYHDDYTNILVQGSALGTKGQTTTAGTPNSTYGAFGAWPSNRSDSFVSNLSADLPLNSRYIGTLNYTSMRQDAAFPASCDINIGTGACGVTTTGTALTPATITGSPANLGGEINTLLFNNVLNTKITPELTAKTSFRYYDQDNKTPEYLETSAGSVGGGAPVNTLSMGYIKSNAGEELNWRPNKYWNLGAAYNFEHYDWTRTDVNHTNQNGGKVFVDYMPFGWLTSRASGEYTSRKMGNYNYLEYVGAYQWLNTTDTAAEQYFQSYRQFMFDNRTVWTGKYSLDVVAAPGVTVTPWTKYTDAHYQVDPITQQGLQDSRRWDSGVDATWMVRPNLAFTVGYSWDYQNAAALTSCVAGSSATAPGMITAASSCTVGSTTIPAGSPLAAYQLETSDRQTQSFVTAGVRYSPTDQLDLSLHYVGSLAQDNMVMYPAVSAALPGNTNGQFVPNKVWYQRLDATGIYKFSPEQVAALGWKGDIKAKLNYTWESNSESNWENDPLSPYAGGSMGTATQADLWLGWYNPNYNVQMISASLIASW